MKKFKVSLTKTQLTRLRALVPNIYEYLEGDKLAEGCNAYRFGLRTREDIDNLIDAITVGGYNSPRATIIVNRNEAMVLRDRLEMAWEIASENGDPRGDEQEREEQRCAVSYRDGMNRIAATIIKSGEIL